MNYLHKRCKLTTFLKNNLYKKYVYKLHFTLIFMGDRQEHDHMSNFCNYYHL